MKLFPDSDRLSELKVRADFPLLANDPGLHYLDSAATSQKPRAVLDALRDFYETANANPHRGAYTLSVRATEFYATRYQSLPVLDWLESRPPLAESADLPAAADLARGLAHVDAQVGDVRVRRLEPVIESPGNGKSAGVEIRRWNGGEGACRGSRQQVTAIPGGRGK